MNSPYREASSDAEARVLRRKVDRMRRFLRHQIKGVVFVCGIATLIGCFLGTTFVASHAIEHGIGDTMWRDMYHDCDQRFDACRSDRDACHEAKNVARLTDCPTSCYDVNDINEAWVKRARRCEESVEAAWAQVTALVDRFFPSEVESVFREETFRPLAAGNTYTLGTPSAMWWSCDKLPSTDMMRFQAVYCIDSVGHKIEMTIGNSR